MIPRAVLAATVALLAAGCAGSGTAATPGKPIPVGDRRGPEAAVKGETLDGTQFDLASLKGKVVVVNFWASWCGPCRAEAPGLAQTAKDTKAEGVEFLGVDTRDTKDSAKAFLRTFGTGYPSIFDPKGEVTQAFASVNPSALPTTLILDRRGRVAVQFSGLLNKSGLDPALAKIVAER